MKRPVLPVAIAVGTLLLVSACSQDPEPAPALPPEASAPAAAPTAAATAPSTDAGAAPQAGAMNSYTAGQGESGYQDGATTLQVVESERFGQYVVDGEGFTLYRFDPDNANPSKATCNDACATTWPPTLASHTVQFSGLDRHAIGVVKRDDRSVQMTVGGWPVYRFSKDTQPRQNSGEGVGGTWFVVAPDGSKASQN
jgi:predicted lipoprotein with Yx(FWY)xxD motif